MSPSFGLDPDLAAVDLDDASYEGEPDAGALVLVIEALEEREDLLLILRLDPAAVVAHEEHGLVAVACASSDFEEVPLSRIGSVWSYTENHYEPPAPYVSPQPFVPYTVAAVELADEKMVVLGQIAADVDASQLRTGMQVELVVEKLYEDDDSEYLIWKWRPLAA